MPLGAPPGALAPHAHARVLGLGLGELGLGAADDLALGRLDLARAQAPLAVERREVLVRWERRRPFFEREPLERVV